MQEQTRQKSLSQRMNTASLDNAPEISMNGTTSNPALSFCIAIHFSLLSLSLLHVRERPATRPIAVGQGVVKSSEALAKKIVAIFGIFVNQIFYC